MITSFCWGPLPDLYVVLVTVSVHEPEERTLVPDAVLSVLSAEVSVKDVALLVNFRVTATFTNAALKIFPSVNRNV